MQEQSLFDLGKINACDLKLKSTQMLNKETGGFGREI